MNLNMLLAGLSQELTDCNKWWKVYEGKQYDHLASWWKERDHNGKFVPTRHRKPGIRYNLGKSIVERVRDFLVNQQTLPEFSSADASPALSELLQTLRKDHLLAVIPEACLYANVQGSAAITFSFQRGKLCLKPWRRDQARPVCDASGDLLGLVVMYQGEHPMTGKISWWRMTLDAMTEVWEYSEDSYGTSAGGWIEHSRVEHKLGFVPAVWVRHGEGPGIEGTSLMQGIEDHLRELDYSYSREQRALNYTADPQPVISSKEPTKTAEALVKSPGSTWALDENGKAFFMEISGDGIKLQGEFSDKLRKGALEVARVVLPDPNKVGGAHLSGYALRILYEPMIGLCDQLKTKWEPAMAELLQKILLAMRAVTKRGESIRVAGVEGALDQIKVPAAETESIAMWHGWLGTAREWPLPVAVETSLPISAHWGPYFDPSPEEESTIIGAAAAAKTAGIVSAETAVRMVAPFTGVASVEEELRRLAAETGAADPVV